MNYVVIMHVAWQCALNKNENFKVLLMKILVQFINQYNNVRQINQQTSVIVYAKVGSQAHQWMIYIKFKHIVSLVALVINIHIMDYVIHVPLVALARRVIHIVLCAKKTNLLILLEHNVCKHAILVNILIHNVFVILLIIKNMYQFG